jgi:hypothetical protein
MPSGHPITQVTEEDVARLDALELVKVTHKLLLCEARRLGIERPNLYSTTRINVADGGRDLGWENSISVPCAYIPRDKTFYQCKASQLTPGVIKNEILNHESNALKPRVAEVLLQGGAYVFVTTDSWIRRTETQDIHAIVAHSFATVGAVINPDSKVEVLGREKMAEWINHYPSVIAYVLRVTSGFSTTHYFDVEAWKQNPEMEGDYVETPALLTLRKQIRNEALSQVGSVSRLTGLSGLGKTRLAFELVRKHDDEDHYGAQLEAFSVYFNYGDHPGAAMNLLLGLSSSGFEGLVLVDDCPPDVHRRIRDRVGGRRLTILTLYHEPEPSAENSFVLTPEHNKEVVIEILRKDPRSKVFSEDELKRIADFGEGFPSIARMMLDQFLVPTDRLLSENEIAARLLGDGTNRDSVREDVFGAHCLFRRIGGDQTTLREQTRFLEETFLKDVRSAERIGHREQLQRRGLLKLIGDVRLTAPRPLAVAFAIRKFESIDPTVWPELLQRIETAGLLRSFCQRLREMEVSQRRQEIGEHIANVFHLDDASFLGSGAGGELFRAVALMNPVRALACLRGTGEADLSEDFGAGWQDVIRGLKDIAWHSRCFLAAARFILRFATSGPNSIRTRAAEYFTSFYHIALSGTKKPAIERLDLIREALSGDVDPVKSISINALGAALQHSHFTRTSDTSITGIGDPHFDWYPNNYAEVAEYHSAAFRMLADLILNQEGFATQASEVIANGLGGVLANHQLIQDLDALFRQLADSKNNLWPTAKNQIQLKLEMRNNELSPSHRESLTQWLSYVTPESGDFESRYRDLVGSANYHYVDGEDGLPVNASERDAVSFADEFLQEPFDLRSHADLFLTGPQARGFAFGQRLASSYPQIDDLLDTLLERWAALSVDERNPTFICGIVGGFASDPNKRQTLLDRIATTPELLDLLLYSTTSGPLEIRDIRRIRVALIENNLSPDGFYRFGLGRMTDPLDPADFMGELDQILEGRPEMAGVILHVLSMYCFQNTDRFRATASLFKKLVVHNRIREANDRHRYDWKSAAIQLVMIETNEQWYRELAENIFEIIKTSHYSMYSNGEYAEVIRLMLNKSPQVISPVISEALRDSDDRKVMRLGQFLARTDGWRDESGSPLWALSPDDFQSWLRENLQLVPILLEHMPLFVTNRVSGSNGVVDVDLDPPRANSYQWHPHTRILLEEGIESSKIRNAMISNLLSFGSTGSRVPYLEERKRIVQELLSSEDGRLVSIAREIVEIIDNDIERERRFDLNQSAEFI